MITCLQAEDESKVGSSAPPHVPPAAALSEDLEGSLEESVSKPFAAPESVVPSPTEPAVSPTAAPAASPPVGPDALSAGATPTVTAPKDAPAVAMEAVPLQGGATLQITSSTHKREWQALSRVASGPRRLEFPEIARLFTGTKAEQRKVLAAYVNSGENPEEVESTFTIVRKHSQKMTGKRRLMTVAQMKSEGFSEYFAGITKPFFPIAFCA